MHATPNPTRGRLHATALIALLCAPFAAGAAGTTLDLDFMVDGRAVYESAQDIRTIAHLPRTDHGSTAVLAYRVNCPTGKTCVSLAQYRDDGSNGGRFAPPNTLNFDIIGSAAIDSQNRIVIVGATEMAPDDYDFRVIRLLPDGTPDSTFTGDGLGIYSFDRGGSKRDVAHAVAIDALDRIVVVGAVQQTALNDIDFGVLRLMPDGSVDATFGVNGRQVIAFDLRANGRTDVATVLAIDADSRITVGGTVKDFDVNVSRIGLARLTPSGAFDTSWCNTSCNYNPYPLHSGRRVIFFGEDSEAREHTVDALDVTPDGEVFVGGTMRFGGVITGYVLHMASDGEWLHQTTLDGGTLIGGSTELGGIHTVGIGGGAHEIIVTGTTGPSAGRLFFAQRLDAALFPIAGWGNLGDQDSVYSLSATNSFWDFTAIPALSSVDGRGRVLLAGTTRESDDPTPLRAMTARLTSTLAIFRDGFEGDIPIGR